MSQSPTMKGPTVVSLTATHILTHLNIHRATHSTSSTVPPLFVALQGPQGSGKTHLTRHLSAQLSSPPHSLRLAVFSLDDLYLPHVGLRKLADTHSTNALLRGRGLPGTHDVGLGVGLLSRLSDVNRESFGQGAGEVELPVFDKSLYGGEGDRLPVGAKVAGPLDVVLLEGWCMGFYPIGEQEIARRWEASAGEEGRIYTKEDISQLNELLKDYLQLWSFFKVFIQLRANPPPPLSSSHTSASPYAAIYKWRLQQEHTMKSANGGRGMSDVEVEKFIDRYIPGYIFFGDGVLRGFISGDELPEDVDLPSSTPGSQLGEPKADDTFNADRNRPPWLGKVLQLTISENREVIGVERY